MSNKKEDLITAWKNAPYCEYMWAQDFVAFLSERPKWIRLLLRFIFGKKAYREFIGMVDVFTACELYICVPAEQDYHNEKTRSDFVDGLKLC